MLNVAIQTFKKIFNFCYFMLQHFTNIEIINKLESYLKKTTKLLKNTNKYNTTTPCTFLVLESVQTYCNLINVFGNSGRLFGYIIIQICGYIQIVMWIYFIFSLDFQQQLLVSLNLHFTTFMLVKIYKHCNVNTKWLSAESAITLTIFVRRHRSFVYRMIVTFLACIEVISCFIFANQGANSVFD